jgi:hypothetical protein
MSWLSLVSGLISLFNRIAGFIRDRKIEESAKAEVRAEALQEQETRGNEGDDIDLSLNQASDAELRRMEEELRGESK